MKQQTYSLPANTLLPNSWDIVAFVLVIALVLTLSWVGTHMSAPYHFGEQLAISLKPTALIGYSLLTTARMFIALFFSTLFSIFIGTLAAKSKKAERLIIPLIDILQSVPVLGYLSFTVTAFIAVFPHSMLGPECAAIFAVFVSQVWNMTLSFYQSLKTIPKELKEATYMYQLSGWQRFWHLEAPYAIPGLLWNAMMSMSGGWFFVVAAEAISVANHTILLPGVGSYISVAIFHQNLTAIAYAILAMLIVIVLYDQLFFRPLVAWSEKFKLTDMPDETSTSWVLDLLQRTRVLMTFSSWMRNHLSYWLLNHAFWGKRPSKTQVHQMADKQDHPIVKWLWLSTLSIIILGLLVWFSLAVLKSVSLAEVAKVGLYGLYTFLRVMALIVVCALIWVPIGIWVGLRPKVARIVQPVAQIFAAFPANLFFPVFIFFIVKFHLSMNIWCAPLMVLGTQWYLLFNVIAGASLIPKELKLAAKNFNLKGLLKWKRFYIPAIFPYIVTGAITAAGGAWNASIVAEIVTWGGKIYHAQGLGAFITLNTTSGDFINVALGVVMMCLWVTLFNFFFWRKLYEYAENRFRLGD